MLSSLRAWLTALIHPLTLRLDPDLRDLRDPDLRDLRDLRTFRIVDLAVLRRLERDRELDLAIK